MNKVIIDGVDVSECEHYRAEIETKMPYGEYEIQKDKCHYSGIEIIQNCKGIKGCIYKQLQRLKEENKQYKKYKFLFEKAKEFKEKTDKWASKCLAENEDLKDTIKRTVCQSECFRYKQANKYKQALKEIRNIVSEPCIVDENCQTCNSGCMQKDILDKINEVIGGNNEN